MNDLSGFIPVFLGGASGVLVVEGAKFAAASMGNRASQKIRTYKRRTYWLGLMALVVVAGFVTVVSVGKGSVTLMNALQIGINAPALVTAWATASQRDAIKKKMPAAAFGPKVYDEKPERPPSVYRKVLNDQAW